jgi:hypothetical protein
MRLFRTFLLIALIFVLIYTGSAYSSSPMDLIHQFTMENGLKMVFEENRNAPVVALQIWVVGDTEVAYNQNNTLCSTR